MDGVNSVYGASLSAVSLALDANDARREALNAQRAALMQALEEGDEYLRVFGKDVDPNLEKVKIKPVEEWAVFAAHGSTTLKPRLLNKALLSDESPFREDALRHKEYLALTTPHPFTPKDKQALAHEVANENRRLVAIAQTNEGKYAYGELSNSPDSDFLTNVEGINWDRVAYNVSESSRSLFGKRSAQECKVQWVGADHPSLKNPADWDGGEDEQLKALVGGRNVKDGEVDWGQLSTHFNGTRNPAHCLGRYLKLVDSLDGDATKDPAWNAEEDADLQAAVDEHGTGNWGAVALALENTRSPSQCFNRWTATIDANIKRGAWTPEEDASLRAAVRVFGQKWSRVKDLVPGRTAPQCRERFVRALGGDHPGLQVELEESEGQGTLDDPKQKSLGAGVLKKGLWSPNEDALLRDAWHNKGLRNWGSIAQHVGTRTERQCAIRWKKVESKDANTSNSSTSASPPTSAPSSPSIPNLTSSTDLGPASMTEGSSPHLKTPRSRKKPEAASIVGPRGRGRGRGRGQGRGIGPSRLRNVIPQETGVVDDEHGANKILEANDSLEQQAAFSERSSSLSDAPSLSDHEGNQTAPTHHSQLLPSSSSVAMPVRIESRPRPTPRPRLKPSNNVTQPDNPSH